MRKKNRPPARAIVPVDFHVLPMSAWVFFGCSSFLPNPKDVYVR